jgi:hypothetical protein
MIRNLLLLALIFIFSLHVKAQDTLVLYYDQDFQKTNDSLAPNVAVAIKQDTLWHFSMFTAESQKLILNGYYDHDFKNMTGRCEYFYENGQRRSLGYFHNGTQAGPWQSWDSEGRTTDSIFFAGGVPKFQYTTAYFEDGNIKDYSFTDGSKSGRKTYNEDGVLVTLQDFDGKAGTVREYQKNGKPRVFSEFNKAGKLTKTTYYSADGTEISEKDLKKAQAAWEKEQLAKTPEYPGGMGSFQTYLFKNTIHTERDDVQRDFEIAFVLNEFGRATDIHVINAPNPTVERSIIRLIQQMTNWDMKGQKTWPVHFTMNLKG